MDFPLHLINGLISLIALIHLIALIDRESQGIFTKIVKSIFLIFDILLNGFLIFYAYAYYTENDLDS